MTSNAELHLNLIGSLGTVAAVAGKVCPAGTHYTWKAQP